MLLLKASVHWTGTVPQTTAYLERNKRPLEVHGCKVLYSTEPNGATGAHLPSILTEQTPQQTPRFTAVHALTAQVSLLGLSERHGVQCVGLARSAERRKDLEAQGEQSQS